MVLGTDGEGGGYLSLLRGVAPPTLHRQYRGKISFPSIHFQSPHNTHAYIMATLSDTQLDLLLREAEARLKTNATSNSSIATKRPVTAQVIDLVPPAKEKETLSVRMPQKSTRPEKVQFNCPSFFPLHL